MKVKLPYGERELPLELPGTAIKGILEAKTLPLEAPEEALVEAAMAHPVDAAPLKEIVRRGETACIIVGDMTRLWVRHHLFIPRIIDALNRGGIPDRDIFIVFATGDHRAQTPAEHCLLAGEEACRRLRVYDHDARNKDELSFLGTTGYGTPVSINRRVVEADRVVLTGGIVYHFLAGWGGGKKAIIPGVAGYDTIMRNHSLAFQAGEGSGLNPAVRAGSTAGNPCSDDMVQGASLVGPDFLVNVVIDDLSSRIARVVAGNFLTAYQAGCRFVHEHFGVPIAEQAELVIASCGGYPKDINFYQSYKTLYNAHFALRKGGTLLLVSESREGVGSEDFFHTFTGCSDNREREAALRRSYTIGGQMAYHTALLAEENDILALTGLSGDEVRAMGLIPIRSIDEGLDFIRRKHGGIPPAYIMPHGGTAFPYLA